VAAQDLVVSERALVVDRDREDAAPFELVEQRPAAAPLEESVAQVPGEAPQDRRSDEELAEVAGQLLDDVACQVLAHDS
jgi:hypothetical protein